MRATEKPVKKKDTQSRGKLSIKNILAIRALDIVPIRHINIVVVLYTLYISTIVPKIADPITDPVIKHAPKSDDILSLYPRLRHKTPAIDP